MGQTSDTLPFATCHPVVPAVYVAVTLVLTMACMQPVLIGLSLLGALSFSCTVRGVAPTMGMLRWQIPVIILISLVNPLFSASGSTELLRIGTHAVYAESLAYGASMGALFVASVTWFMGAAELLPFDRVMTLLGNAAPTVALMISMAMRLIPRFVRQGKTIDSVQRVARSCAPASFAGRAPAPAPGLESQTGDACPAETERPADSSRQDEPASPFAVTRRVARTRLEESSCADRHLDLRLRLRLSSVLMGWTMEDSLETADAMRARGWGAAARRTTYTRFRFGARDAWVLVFIAAFALVAMLLGYVATTQFAFYPTMPALVPWWGYVPYATWMLLPSILFAIERLLLETGKGKGADGR